MRNAGAVAAEASGVVVVPARVLINLLSILVPGNIHCHEHAMDNPRNT